MRKINIFLASSVEFKAGRDELKSFIAALGDVYIGKGLLFSANESTSGLAGCDAAFFIIGRSAGADIGDSFEAAVCRQKTEGAPRIAAYFETADGQLLSGETAAFMDRVTREASCCCNAFEHTDTLKLGILLQLALLCPEEMDVRLDGGKAWQDRAELLSLERHDMYRGHDELQRQIEQRNECGERFSRAKKAFMENPDSSEAYEVFYGTADAFNCAANAVKRIEGQLSSMIKKIYGQERGRLSRKQAEAYWLTERGKFLEAKSVLDFRMLTEEGRRREELLSQLSEELRILVSEQMQLKDINEALADWDGADQCFREAVRLEELGGLPKKTMLAYAQFLRD